ncbi:metal-dependent hydrolase [Gaetbulibacter aquiaggeris]|uniref:Metal-dependent hydrolase n=1 Tax=Gaetbulibacter aquiaggeris TaxID=1735373 RepID=A0ABW7MTC2_9FLAO
MFIGHYALAFGAKKIDKRPSRVMMFVAVQLLDLLWPIFVLLGFETFEIDPGNTALTPLNFTSYPYSHSLFMTVVWAILFASFYLAFTKNKKGSLLLGCLVFSHWILDFITHRPDLPLSPFTDLKVGMGLWNTPIIEIILETGLFLIGVYLYYKTVTFKRKVVFWSLVVVFLLIHFMNIFGPPPPSIYAVAWSANLMWLFVFWVWWIEKK